MTRRPAGIAAALLAPLAWIYRAATDWRNRRYDRARNTREADLPVISVGNLTVGGTGKTPIVEWLVRHLLERGRCPAVVSRGYGGEAGRGPLLVSDGSGPQCEASRCGDEPWALAHAIPGALVVVGSDRVAAAALARRRGADVVVLDDGFQHRRLRRDLDVVLLDSTDPFGGGRLLPAGRLRESPRGLERADLILVTRDPSASALAAIERRIRHDGAKAPVIGAGHRAVGFVDLDGRPVEPPRSGLAFCGVGNPERFRSDLEKTGLELIEFVAFADHHPYGEGELARLGRRAAAASVPLVTTEKDLARIGSLRAGLLPHAPMALRIEARMDDEVCVLQAVDRALERPTRGGS